MIEPMMLSRLGERCEGKLIGYDVQFQSISTDTRSLNPGDLFVALSGENFDGNRFAEQAQQDQACGVVVSQQVDVDVAQLVTPDTRVALAEAAAYCREQFQGPVIGITGSSGKTTARRMLTSIMETQGEVCSNRANHNNEIGVPMTLLALDRKHHSAVIEMGARHIGDIAYLGRFVQPDIAILLNAGSAHIGEFGGYQNIVKGKGEIYQSLPQNGVAIVNLDDPASAQWMQSMQARRVVTFSLDKESKADVYAEDIRLRNSGVDFVLCTGGDSIDITLEAAGQHNVSNALACAAAAIASGVSIKDISKGLEGYRSESGRAHRVCLGEGLELIDDAYNANPASMKAAVDTLELQAGRKIAVLGEMGELGKEAEELHKGVAEYCREKAIDEYWFIGPFAEQMANAVGEKGRVFKDKKEIAPAIRAHLDQLNGSGLCVLLKASRFMALESVISDYTGETN